MKKVIVTTTINPPTVAIEKFDRMPGWELLVIGDLKTPADYKLENGKYFNPDLQENYDKKLSDAIGWNCIQRRNFGLLIAYDMGADVVAVVDDDNIPLEGWGENLHVGQRAEVNFHSTEELAFDPVGATNYPQLWHRGFPLQLLSKRKYSATTLQTVRVDIQADFWNGDPDIDAICRMEHAPECKFDPKYFPIASNKMSPFNSQNTFISRAILENYFLFPHIGRMDDIWAAYYVQSKGASVIYCKPSVYQSRNIHDLTKDMKLEYLGYEHNLDIVKQLPTSPEFLLSILPEQSILAFNLYRDHFQRA
jgi:hypothetical protein